MNGTSLYIPHKGDLVLINFNPSTGQEIQKYRPALVISNQKYAKLTNLAVVCPITHAENNRLASSGLLIAIDVERVSGFVNPLQFHTFDFKGRDMRLIGKADDVLLNSVVQTVNDIVSARELDG